MIKIKIIRVGQRNERMFHEAAAEYQKRLSAFCKLEQIRIKHESISNTYSKKQIHRSLDMEGARILERTTQQDYVIALDRTGEVKSSVSFQKMVLQGVAPTKAAVCFVIGGSHGLSEQVLTRADRRLCLSAMTFTHEMAFLILLEQLYRSFMIMQNRTYHK